MFLRDYFKIISLRRTFSLDLKTKTACVKMNKINKYDYVKQFESDDKCLPNCWIVVRIDGRSFHKFSELHGFEKPNDKRALELMSRAAACVLEEFRDVSVAYGQSDEYSFVFRKDTTLFNRRKDKILTTVLSLFSSSYVFHWSNFFGFIKLLFPPAFDGRVILFPTETNLRDYLSWRQVDAHINNLYNTTFWALVLKKRLTPSQAEEALRGSLASHKNEILYKEFGINYNNEPLLYRKGTVMIRKLVTNPGGEGGKLQHVVIPLCCDIIGDDFWKEHSEILGMKSLAVFNNSQNLPTFGGTKPNLTPQKISDLPPPPSFGSSHPPISCAPHKTSQDTDGILARRRNDENIRDMHMMAK